MIKKDKNIVVLSKARPYECGGTDATLDKSAPKKTVSEDIVFFSVTSSLSGFVSTGTDGCRSQKLRFVSAFAAKYGRSSFLYLETVKGFERQKNCTLVTDDIFPSLNELVLRYDIAKSNGYHSKTHGLPENFGGEVNIKYKSGEKISFSDNQTPVIKPDFADELTSVFEDYMKREKAELPDISTLKEIRFHEARENGFTKASLTLNTDGTATNKKASQYEGGTVFNSEKTVSADTVSAIKSKILDTGLLAWYALPESEYRTGNPKTLTFVFDGGREITVSDGKKLPGGISGGFFNIEFQMT